jgi:hypothetical protein
MVLRAHVRRELLQHVRKRWWYFSAEIAAVGCCMDNNWLAPDCIYESAGRAAVIGTAKSPRA